MGLLFTYALTIFLSAALLFSVQPMFARIVLPLLGGSPGVWNTCMLFFQTMLLAGYAYAHLSTRLLGDRRQSLLHLLIALVAFVFLPTVVPDGWSPPTETTPIFWLLGLLTVAVGVPFFVVSSTAPLLQRWFAGTSHRSAHDPYFLYAASNLGSLLALVGYPIFVEPALRLDEQSRLWMWSYGVLSALLFACVFSLWLSRQPAVGEETTEAANASRPVRTKAGPRREADPLSGDVTPGRRAMWILLSFVPSSWMLGVTTYLTTDIAPVPMLWVVPLAIYLLTFILVFSRRRLIPHRWMVRLFPVVMLLLATSVIFQGIWPLFALHLFAFFIGSMVCHGELARDRPATSHLTEYFFWMSVGGMLGGVFNAIVAPLVFSWLLEYPLTVMLACLLRPSLYPEFESDRPDRIVDLAFLFLYLLAVFVLKVSMQMAGTELLLLVVLASVPVLMILFFVDWPQLFAVGIGLLLLAQKFEPPYDSEVLYSERSFFGVHRVIDDPSGRNVLVHGTIVHGGQSHDPARKCEPLAYYYPTGPLGDVFEEFHKSDATRRVAVVGLGAGAAICYQRPDEEFVFYEIDPVVKQLAESPEYFTYLSGCAKSGYEIVLGDGRIKLAEAPEKHYGLIIFDAFSSDAIPMHLLTREALAMYQSKLADGGLLVFHITNSHLDLKPVLATLAADAGLAGLVRDDAQSISSTELFVIGKMPSQYVVLARRPSELQGLAGRPDWVSTRQFPSVPVWTDDFSNIVSILTWR